VVDHVVRHAGSDDPLFWNEENMQPLCKPCHDGIKQSIDHGQSKHAWGVDGFRKNFSPGGGGFDRQSIESGDRRGQHQNR